MVIIIRGSLVGRSSGLAGETFETLAWPLDSSSRVESITETLSSDSVIRARSALRNSAFRASFPSLFRSILIWASWLASWASSSLSFARVSPAICRSRRVWSATAPRSPRRRRCRWRPGPAAPAASSAVGVQVAAELVVLLAVVPDRRVAPLLPDDVRGPVVVGLDLRQVGDDAAVFRVVLEEPLGGLVELRRVGVSRAAGALLQAPHRVLEDPQCLTSASIRSISTWASRSW